MTEKPTKIPLARRVMPSIIADNIKGVSPMMAPIDSVKNLRENMITEKQGEGQVDIDADIEYFRKKLDDAQRRGDDERVQKLQEQIRLLESHKLSSNSPSV